MEFTAEWVRVMRNISIVSLVFNVPGLFIWSGVLARILIKRTKLWGLVFICCLMIACQISYIVVYRVLYTMYLKSYEGQEINLVGYH
jgi:hypothetical protein